MKSNRIKDLKFFFILIAVVIGINIVSHFYLIRYDFTEDRRYSLSNTTEELLENIHGDIEIEVQFDGEAGADFRELKESVEETLSEFKARLGGQIKYTFIDPLKDVKVDSIRYQRYITLSQVIPPRVQVTKEDGKSTEKMVFPGAIVRYNGKACPINFLKDGANGMEQNFSQSVNEIEYQLTYALKVLSLKNRKKIAFLEGHGEPVDRFYYAPKVWSQSPNHLTEAIKELQVFYDAGRLNIDSYSGDLNKDIDMLIVTQPQKAFTEQEKYKLDQYILKGGRVMFFLDKVNIKGDTTGIQGLPYDLNLDNLLWKYGIRINAQLVEDFYAGQNIVQDPNNKYKPQKWGFYPILGTMNQNHIITYKLNPIIGKYTNTIDTVKAVGMRKTPLIASSSYTKIKSGELLIYKADELRFDKDEKYYNSGSKVVAYLLEGKAQSLYDHRPIPEGVNGSGFVNQGKNVRVMVVADGDIITNMADFKNQRDVQMGFNMGATFANKSFLNNAVSYMLDEKGIVNLRAKEVQPRPLDQFKIDNKAEKLKWQAINIVAPLIIVILSGIGWTYLRRKKFGK